MHAILVHRDRFGVPIYTDVVCATHAIIAAARLGLLLTAEEPDCVRLHVMRDRRHGNTDIHVVPGPLDGTCEFCIAAARPVAVPASP